MSEPEEITTMSGQKLPLKMSVDYISFSAHTDYQQTSEFIRALKPPHVVSIHALDNPRVGINQLTALSQGRDWCLAVARIPVL